MLKKHCKDCGLPAAYHIQTWLDEITSSIMPRLRLPKKIESFFDVVLEKTFSSIGLIKMRDDFLFSEIQMRSACFIDEARKRGVKFQAAKGPVGYTNHFCAKVEGTKIRFESLPVAEHVSKYDVSFVDCKERTKNHLKKGGFPIADGKSFWFWQKNRALKFGSNELGFPLVVKPRGGSVARHVTTNIRSRDELLKAINKAVIYSPVFVVERFVENSFVYRATVVDFNFVAVVKQVPANIAGDGSSTIQELIKRKNSDKKRGEPNQKDFTLYKIVIDETTEKLLAEKGYNLETVPKKDEIVYLQKNPFLKLGGDLVEVTDMAHPDNIQLFKDIAKFFDIRLVGIDFLVPDISSSWQNQQCAVLELNSVPCIETHHFPSSGAPQNVANALVDLFFKYYL
jgi:cyanophycin synthetase